MSDIKIQPSATGSGTVTITAPTTNTARVITLPDSAGTLLDENSSVPSANLTGTVVDARISALTASKLTGDLPAISGVNVTNVHAVNSGKKNMVINGAMQVAQRGTSETGYTARGYYTCDRWLHEKDGSTGTYTMTQEADAPAGFKNSLKVNCTTAGTSGDYDTIHNKIEAQDLSHLEWGTASAKSITLSFWVKASQTGTMQFNLLHYADAGTRQISYLYTIDSANTWEKKTVTFAGDTVRANDDDNSQGFILEWFLNSYGGRTGSAVQTSWGNYNNPARFEGATISIGDSTSDTWQIAGVQLEVGSVATDFEHRSYGEELALCQRYFENMSQAGNEFRHNGIAWNTDNLNVPIAFLVEKRTTPTIASTSNGDVYTGSWVNATGVVITGTNKRGCTISVQTSGGYVVKYGYFIRGQTMTADAEL